MNPGSWIHVDERLPEPDQRVLVYAEGIFDMFIGGHVIAITSMTDKNPLWPNITIDPYWRDPWQYFCVDYKITHWMPLPDPPKPKPKAKTTPRLYRRASLATSPLRASLSTPQP